jgi:hypothetical protein
MSQRQTKKTRRRVKAEAKKQTKKIVLETILDLERQSWKVRLSWAWRILTAKDYFLFKKKGLIPGVEADPKIDDLGIVLNAVLIYLFFWLAGMIALLGLWKLAELAGIISFN